MDTVTIVYMSTRTLMSNKDFFSILEIWFFSIYFKNIILNAKISNLVVLFEKCSYKSRRHIVFALVASFPLSSRWLKKSGVTFRFVREHYKINCDK